MWNQIVAFTQSHQLVIFFVLAVLVEQLPPPTEASSAFYKYFYSVAQLLTASWKRAKDALVVKTGKG